MSNIKVIHADKPYKPKNGDLVCGFDNEEVEKYLQDPGNNLPEGQVLPLCLIHPNTWQAVKLLDIDAKPICCRYECPYTNYEFYSIVPAVLVSTDLNAKWGKIVQKVARWTPDYVLDHEYHRETYKERVFDLNEIGKFLIGPGYTHGTHITDGSGSIINAIVNLDNGDFLYVYLLEWYNK